MFGILVNKDGLKIDFGLVDFLKENLQVDEQIIGKDWSVANSMNKPKWNFDKKIWEETEPKEEDNQQIDKTKISPTTDELKEENERLWETVEFLLKQVNMIPKES